MALIVCPECKNKISSEANACPKCGYELNTNGQRKINTSKPDKTKIIIGLIFVIVGIIYFTGGFKSLTNPSPSGSNQYKDNFLGITFEYPSGYLVATLDDNITYVYKQSEGDKIVIPYGALTRYDSFNNIETFFLSLDASLKKAYGTTLLNVSQLYYGEVGDKSVGLVTYTYTMSGKTITDNRYAFLMNNKVYTVFTKSTTSEDTEINNLANTIINTMREA